MDFSNHTISTCVHDCSRPITLSLQVLIDVVVPVKRATSANVDLGCEGVLAPAVAKAHKKYLSLGSAGQVDDSNSPRLGANSGLADTLVSS